MSLMINQGKQDTTNDKLNYEPFEEKDVVGVVEKLELNKYLPGCFNVSFRLMTGAHKGQIRTDTVTYEASNPMSWKYRALRNCCGEPYKENEPAQIDIEAKLLQKILILDFTVGTKQDGTKRQDIRYRRIDQKHLDKAFPKVEDIIDDADLPFNQPEIPVTPEPTQTTPKTVPGVDVTEPVIPTISSNDDDEWD